MGKGKLFYEELVSRDAGFVNDIDEVEMCAIAFLEHGILPDELLRQEITIMDDIYRYIAQLNEVSREQD